MFMSEGCWGWWETPGRTGWVSRVSYRHIGHLLVLGTGFLNTFLIPLSFLVYLLGRYSLDLCSFAVT